jgi:diguanylate cyclase (GGDEF)-like protein
MDIKKQTILVVDDTPVNIEILAGVLGADYDILFATSGNDGLRIAAEQLPDLILLDVVMPDKDGYEVCRQLKANEPTRDIPVIFITAMSQEEDESQGLDAGAIDYITKPFRSSIVKARVRNHLELKRFSDFLEVLSTLDGLTGIPNRRRFDEVLEREWLRARRNHSPISLLMMDIDFFKLFNDHYGHLAGDECLRQIAKGIAAVIRRPADFAARYGGEEFVFVLPDTDIQGARWLGQKVHEKVESLNIVHAFSPVAARVTLSIGAACATPTDDLTPFDLIEAADESLFSAKRNGRNRTEINYSFQTV